MKKDDGNTFQTGPDIVIPISYQSGFFASVSVTGTSRQDAWGNLLDVFTAACESKQNNDGIWPISVSTNRGKIEMNEHDHNCHCGTSNFSRHQIGENGCVRQLVEAPLKSGDKWFVDGREITDFSLRQQRGYYQHPCGCWSRSPGSDNSIS